MMRQAVINLAAAGSAFMASICCIGPITLASLGFGGAALVAGLESYRPLLIGLTLTLLGAAYYFAYRQNKQCDDENCTQQSVPKSTKIRLWVLTLVSLLLLAFPFLPLSIINAGNSAQNESYAEVTIHVDGLPCSSCNVAVEVAVGKLDGVHSVTADHQKSNVSIEFNPEEVEVEDFLRSINSLGYTAKAPQQLGGKVMTTIEFLYFEGCPLYERALSNLKAVLANLKASTELKLINVASADDAEPFGFQGSPSIRVNGVDLDGKENDYSYSCRVYTDETGRRMDVPTADYIRTRLTAIGLK